MAALSTPAARHPYRKCDYPALITDTNACTCDKMSKYISRDNSVFN